MNYVTRENLKILMKAISKKINDICTNENIVDLLMELEIIEIYCDSENFIYTNNKNEIYI